MFRLSLWWGLLLGLVYYFWRFFSPRHSELILQDGVVIVTGASSGIGRALAMAFARRGARVILTARREDLLEDVQREIEPYAAATHIIAADLTDEDQCQQVVAEALAHFGQVDVLVNNAGRSEGGLFQDSSVERINTIVDLNLRAPILLTRAILPHLIARGGGAIVNVASSAGRASAPTFVTYSASKHGLAAFSDALRREIQGKGVQILLALPGWTRTEMVPPQLVEKIDQRGFSIQEPEAVAEAIVEALVQGREEIVMGGFLIKAGLLAERYFPILHRIYWRLNLTRDWIDATRYIP